MWCGLLQKPLLSWQPLQSICLTLTSLLQITLFYAHPAMVVALAWLCKGELVGALGVLGMLASLLGVMFVAQPPFLTGGSTWSTQQLTGTHRPGTTSNQPWLPDSTGLHPSSSKHNGSCDNQTSSDYQESGGDT